MVLDHAAREVEFRLQRAAERPQQVPSVVPDAAAGRVQLERGRVSRSARSDTSPEASSARNRS